jgi:hypothetical protein
VRHLVRDFIQYSINLIKGINNPQVRDIADGFQDRAGVLPLDFSDHLFSTLLPFCQLPTDCGSPRLPGKSLALARDAQLCHLASGHYKVAERWIRRDDLLKVLGHSVSRPTEGPADAGGGVEESG